MRRVAIFLLISTFVMNSCRNGGADKEIDDNTDDGIVNDDSGDGIDGGTLVVEASFEGTMLPFTDHPNFDGLDIFSDPTAPDGSRCLRFSYPPGFPSGESTDLAWICFEQGRTEVKMEYHFKYSDNFYFHPVANKQLYVPIGEHTDIVISAVDTFAMGGVGANTMMSIGLQDANVGFAENRIPNMAEVAIRSDIWYKITLYFKLNKDSQPDGIIKLWVDDTQISDYSDIVFNRGVDANTPCSCIKFDPVWGGVGNPKPNITDYFYIDAVKIWAGPFESDNH